MEEYFTEKSNRIKSGNEHTMYMIYCYGCNIFKRLSASPPMGPGGTLSCPICRIRKKNGPGIAHSYGRVKVKSFKIILPKEVDI